MQQAVCVRRKKISKKNAEKKSAPTKTHHEIHSSPATASNSRRHARKHVLRVSPYSPASIDPGFVEIGLVQLSQSVITTNVTHTLTDTDRQLNNSTLYAPRCEEAFLPIGKERPHYEEAFLPIGKKTASFKKWESIICLRCECV